MEDNPLVPIRPDLPQPGGAKPYDLARTAVLDVLRSFTFNGKPMGVQGTDIQVDVGRETSGLGTVSMGQPTQRGMSGEEAVIMARTLARSADVDLGTPDYVQPPEPIEVPKPPERVAPPTQTDSAYNSVRSQNEHPRTQHHRTERHSPEEHPREDRGTPATDVPTYTPPNEIQNKGYHQIGGRHAKQSKPPADPSHLPQSEVGPLKRDDPRKADDVAPAATMTDSGPIQVIGMVGGQLCDLLVLGQLVGVI